MNMSTGPTPGTLYLVPVNLAAPFSVDGILPRDVAATTRSLSHFIVENAKSARAFLKAIGTTRPLADLAIIELDKHRDATAADIAAWLAPLRAGHHVGLMSEAGAPGVADPGADVVAAAHAAGIVVRPLVGPSSLLLALMASGLNGQSFAFHGYLPQDRAVRTRQLLKLEKQSREERRTQIAIETPYRNAALFDDLLKALSPDTRLCIAADLTGAHEFILTRSIAQWRAPMQVAPPFAERVPAMFLFLA